MVTMDASGLTRAVRAGLAGGVVVAALGFGPLLSQAEAAKTTPNLKTAVKYLTNKKNLLDGNHYGSADFADIGLTIDGAYALAATKTDNAVLTQMVDYVAANGDSYDGVGTDYPSGGAIGKVALLAEAVGQNPRSFGGANLISALNSAVCTTTSSSCPAPGAYEYGSSTFDQALGIMAQVRAGDSANAKAPIAYLESLQESDGAWPSLIPSSGDSDPDSTGMAVMALALAGGKTATAAEQKGIAWLASDQLSTGGWDGASGDSINSAALALMGLQLESSTYATQIANGEKFLARNQNSNGGFRIAQGTGPKGSDLRASTQAVSGVVRTSFGALNDPVSASSASSDAVSSSLPTETTKPATVEVRVEGADQTLFEGPVETEGGYIQASSDTQPRECDGTNNNAYKQPVPTATKAAVDGMQIVGQPFDGQWYDGYDDYFITSFGPDAENTSLNYYWGVLLNDTFTPVGGCQAKVNTGDQLLWQYNAFNGQPFLKLAPVGDDISSAPPLTVSVVKGQPLALQVDSYDGGSSTYTPVSGVEVAPVTTAKQTGFETVDTSSPKAVTTDSSGLADVKFKTLGWHRIKAAGSNDTPTGQYLRSNRLDVCVEKAVGVGCGALPADDQVRCVAAVPCKPIVDGATPRRGPEAGGTKVTITGWNFVPGTTVSFGGVQSTSVAVVSDEKLKAVAPAQLGGTVDVTVTTPGGTSAKSTEDHFTYR
jgi:hypothetical protein